jgi:pimeloyl-ACP methyl ester carboxylesterase
LAPEILEVATSFTALFCLRFPLALMITLVAPGLAAAADVSGRVDIGGGRKMYLACSGVGSPTVVLISGKGNGAADWKAVLDPADPAHNADYDAVAWGKGDLHESESAVFPMVSRWTRVCAYDRPGTRLEGADHSTPIAQPHRADQAADDLHRLLTAAGEFSPYVLVAHSYGGVISTLFARTWPAEVTGLVMVDTVTELMQRIASPEARKVGRGQQKIVVRGSGGGHAHRRFRED